MGIRTVKYRLNKEKSKTSQNVNLFLPIKLDSEQRLLPPSKINRLVNLGEVFDNERDNATKYRFIFTITPIFSNVLFNVHHPNRGPSSYGDTNNEFSDNRSYGYSIFNNTLFRKPFINNDFVGGELNLEESISRNLREVNGWFGFYDPDVTRNGVRKFYDLEPKRTRFELDTRATTKNWEVAITYPYTNDSTHYIVNGGLLLTSLFRRNFGGRDLVVIGSVVPHNLKVGDTVRISDTNSTTLNGDFTVLGLGLENGDNENTFFVIDVNFSEVSNIANTQFSGGRMKRLYFGNEVEYYLRKFRKLVTSDNRYIGDDNYEMYPLSFSKTIYNDNNYQLVFTDTIDLNTLVDNLNRPISELYLTFIKTNSNNIFSDVKSGFDLENFFGNVNTNTIDARKISNIRKIHNNGALGNFESHTPLEVNIKITDDDFFGDVCEYSKYEFRETILKEVIHRFNTKNRDSVTTSPAIPNTQIGPRDEGYLYQPHHMIKIKNFSNYVEYGDQSSDEIPQYAQYLSDDRYVWRDILTLGFNDGQTEVLDYPFTNGYHYIHKNITLLTKRQDPFGEFNLQFNKSFPRDIPGDGLNDFFIVKTNRDEC